MPRFLASTFLMLVGALIQVLLFCDCLCADWAPGEVLTLSAFPAPNCVKKCAFFIARTLDFFSLTICFPQILCQQS